MDLILGQINHGSISSPQKDLLPSPQSEVCDSQNNNNSQHPCDVIGKGLITHDEADRLLEIYHNVIPNFPYVQLPRGITSEDLRSEKPFLLLSILLVSSFQNVPLHLALEEVSTSYIGRTVLQGDYSQSLDTIQGLLVTVAG